MKKNYIILLSAIALMSGNVQAQTVSTFDDITIPSPNSYLNASGDAVNGSFSSGRAELPNVYETMYGGYWGSGWAYSNIKNDTTAGFANLYAAYAAGGNGGSANYAVGQQSSILRITGADKGKPVKGLYVTNGTFAALSMKNGDGFAKKFGGASGNDTDFFLLSVKGYHNGTLTTDSVKFYLADYRFANNAQDYIVKSWTWVNLLPLGNVDSLLFKMYSSDTGTFGINTPLFFCADDVISDSDTADFENLNLAPGSSWNKANASLHATYTSGHASFMSEYTTSSYGDYWSSGFAISNMVDSTTAGFTNLYGAITGTGYNGSANYAVSQDKTVVKFTAPAAGKQLDGFYVTNATYAALSMKNGDTFAKKFGGTSGNDADFFVLTVKGYNNGVKKTDTVNFYLADYRFTDNSKDYIVKTWEWVDLKPLGNVDSISFTLSSSDVTAGIMNTPAFFCIDNFTTRDAFTGIASADRNEASFGFYPNPAGEQITISHASADASIIIFDMSGKQLLQQELKNGPVVSVASLPAGLYLLQISDNGTTAVQKLVIK